MSSITFRLPGADGSKEKSKRCLGTELKVAQYSTNNTHNGIFFFSRPSTDLDCQIIYYNVPHQQVQSTSDTALPAI
jgi:hypothetical protein